MIKFYPSGNKLVSKRNLWLKTLTFIALFSPLLSIAQVWENVGSPERISSGGSSFTNLAKDPSGNLYVSYYDVAVTKGSVQKFDGTSWSYLGNQGITTGIATFNALAVKDAQNIFYSNQGSSAMNVRKFDGSAWANLPDAENTTINTQSLTVDANGVVYAFSGASSGRVKRYVNGAWEQVGTSGFTGQQPAFLNIKAGTNGKIYVSFNNNGYVNVYQNDATANANQAWTPVGASSNVATASSSENYNSSLAIDSNNSIYLAYVTGQKLNVKKFNGTWTTLGTENFSAGKVQFVSIAVNSAGIPYVVCSNWENDDFLKNYAYGFDGANWIQLGGFISSGEARYNSLIVDQNDDLILAYSDSGVRVKKFEIINPIATYCDISFPQSAEPISQVTFAGIDNSSVATITSATPQYEDFTTVFGQVTKGSTYPISISGFNPANTIGNFANHIAVYFDWNRNGSFDDAGEVYYLGYIQGNAAVSTLTGNIEVPANASLGNTRMRVVKKYYTNTNATSIPSACNSTGYGQAEDYTITVYDQEPVAVESVTVNILNNALPEINTLGGNLQLTATVLPTNSNQNITWSISQGSDFATISSTGLVTATANGTVIAKATSIENASLFGTKEITITIQAVPSTCTFTALSLTGFNADVIAEGNGNADTRTSAIVDAANVFYAKDFVPANPHSSGANATVFGGGLPNNGLVSSNATEGLDYQFASYAENNALVLRNSLTNSGTLTLDDSKKASKVYVAAVSAEGTNTVNVTVNFEDNTSESFSFQATDWWQTNAPANKIANGLGRVSRGASWAPLNQFDGLSQTGIYQNELELSVANQNKAIISLTFTQNPPSGNATTTTILAVSICEITEEVHTNGPVTITSGFNHDIIANGVGNASASTTVGFDEANTRALVSLDFKATASSNTPSFGLPINGTINSVTTPGVSFQLANYTGPNALFLTPSHVGNNAPNSGTLEFSASNVGKLYILAGTASGGSNNLSFDATVNFSDGSSQTVNNIAISDWYDGQNFAIQGIGRVNTANNNLEGNATNPRLYEIALNLEEQNQTKAITGVSFSFSGDANADYASQIRMSVLAITTAEANSNENALVVTTTNNSPATITTNQGYIELEAKLNGEYVSYTDLIWTVEAGQSFANVSMFGGVTGVSNGTATIRATLASDTTIFGEIDIVVSGQNDGYCEAYFINGCDEYTSIVSVNTTGDSTQIANSHSGCSNDNGLSGYGNFTAHKATAKRNDNVDFTVNFSGSTSYLSVWIDWNQDFIFSDSERVYFSTDAESTTATTFTVNVPNDAVLGETRIRIKAVNGWEGSGACGFNSFGEVEDYTFEVQENLGVDNHSLKNLKIYPNPTSDFATIQTTEIIKEVTIFNMIGQQISKESSSTINLSNVEQGVYLVHIQFENGKSATQKMVRK